MMLGVRQIPDVHHISTSQWICLSLSHLKPRRTVASGLAPHCANPGLFFFPFCGTMGGFVFSAHQGNLDFWSCFVRITKMGRIPIVISRMNEWRVADSSRHLLSVLACECRRSHQSQCWLDSLTVVRKLRFAMWTRVSRLEYVKHCCLLVAFCFAHNVSQ